MKRVVIILDTVRFHEAKILLWPTIGGTLYRAKSLEDDTTGFYREAKPYIETFPGRVHLITTGWGQKAGLEVFKADYRWMFPLNSAYEVCLKEIKVACREKEDSLVIIHDFWIHNYFDDIGALKDVTPDNALRVYSAYINRIQRMIFILTTLIKDTRDLPIELFLTADHGEGFWERPGQCHHGPSCRDPEGVSLPEVRDIFLLKVGGEDRIDFRQSEEILIDLYGGLKIE